MDLHNILNKVKSGDLSVEEAQRLIKIEPFEEMGFAKIDSHRQIRQGQAEVVYCSGKKNEYLLDIFKKIYEMNGEVLGTRASYADIAATVLDIFGVEQTVQGESFWNDIKR